MDSPRDNDQVFDHLQYRILTHYHAAMSILAGRMPAPRTAIVYPTYVCNQNCTWCEYRVENDAWRDVMTTEHLRGLLRDLYELGVRGTEFCGGGEPTLHPDLAELMREAHGYGMRFGLLTNGTKCRGELAEALVDCASYVRVGFDGATAATMDRVKRPKAPDATFDAVCENVRAMLRLRGERGTSVRISMKVVLDNTNYREVPDCVALARELGVDSIQFKAARLCPTELNDAECVEVHRMLRDARRDHPGLPVVGGVDKLNMVSPCWLTPLQTMIDARGDVYLCCYYIHRKGSHTIGNCFETPLRDLWYSDRHWEAIRGIQPGECNNLDCRFVKYNDIMTQLLLENDGQFEFI